MDDLSLFPDVAVPTVALTESQQGQIDAQRKEWNRRQRKCRAFKKWRARTGNAPQFREQPFPPQAELAIVGAVFVARQFAERAFRTTQPADITDDALRLLFDTAGTVFEKGLTVSRETVLAQLKSEGVIFIDAGKLIDTVIDLTPRRLVKEDVDDWASKLSAA
jgi:hypothetical protein